MNASDPKGEMILLDNEISFGNGDGPEANLASRPFKEGALKVSLADLELAPPKVSVLVVFNNEEDPKNS
jgi:hypothetical protein